MANPNLTMPKLKRAFQLLAANVPQRTICEQLHMGRGVLSKYKKAADSLKLSYEVIGLSVRCYFCVLITFPSVVCFRCRKRPLYRRERGKVFELNTLRRRKIQPETTCRLTFSLSEESVLT